MGLCNLNYLLLVRLALRMMYVVDFVEKERAREREKNPVTPCKGDTEYLSFAQRETRGVEATVPTTERAHRLLTEDRILSLVGQRDIMKKKKDIPRVVTVKQAEQSGAGWAYGETWQFLSSLNPVKHTRWRGSCWAKHGVSCVELQGGDNQIMRP